MDKLVKVLRQFQTVDQFGLTELLTNDDSPSSAVIVSHLKRYREALPPGIPADYLAQAIHGALNDESGHGRQRLPISSTSALERIPKGNAAASRYHKHIMKILTAVFADDLTDPKTEVHQFGGRKRIDIVFRNASIRGFFEDLSKRHSIKCPYVPVECKNYSSDPSSPELDQLSGRLNDKIGQLGILVCREIEDRGLLRQRCLDYVVKKEYILTFDDTDIIDLINSHLVGDQAGVYSLLESRLRELVFN